MADAKALTRSYPAALALTATAYAATAVLGLQWSVIPGAGTAVWPAAGVAFAALVIGGLRLWPAVVAGRLATAMIVASPAPFWIDLLVALATTAGAAVPVYLIGRAGGLDRNLGRMRDVVWLALGGALGGALISATFGAGALMLDGLPAARVGMVWITWLTGFAVGTLIFGPLILSWWQRSAWRMSARRWAHYATCMATVAIVSYLTFNGRTLFPAWYVYPALVWAALAFQVRGASVALLIASLFAIGSALQGTGVLTAFADDPNGRVLFAQQFIAVSALTILFLAAVADERRATARLRESERRFRLMADSSPALIWVTDEDGRIVFANRRYRELFGRPAEAMHGDGWRDIVHRADVETFEAAFRAAFAARERFERDVRVVDGAGAVRWLHCEGVPRFARGRFAGYTGVNVDITAAKLAEQAIRDSEATSHLALRAGNMSSWRWDMKTGMMSAVGSVEIFGYGAGTVSPASEVTDRIHPDDRAMAEAATLKAIAAREPYSLEYRFVQPNGDVSWLATHAQPLFDDAGQLTHLIGVSQIITERKRAEAHRQLLVNELNHRVKNTLAVVQGLAQQSFKDERVPSELRSAFEGRLMALAAAHNVLTRENWESAPLRQIVDDAVRPFGPARFRTSGPDLRIEPKPAVSLALALHELATNAAKYGALSAEGGSVELDWTVQPGDALGFHLRWCETGGPAVAPPTHRGFGSRLIERGLAAELDGEVKMDYRPDGVCCDIRAPLDRLAA
jgi:PAS domain S-box-containing protein